MKFQITSIQFDCSLDDEDWSSEDQFNTEKKLAKGYSGQVWDCEDEEDLVDSISDKSGWCIKSIDYIKV